MPYKDKEARTRYATQYKRLRKANGNQTQVKPRSNPVKPSLAAIPADVRARTAIHVGDVIWEQIDAARAADPANKDLITKCTAIVSMASVALRAVETFTLTERMAAIESAMGQRPEPENTHAGN